MNNKICNCLSNIEKENGIHILFAGESGSRAWGFASPDSDYDIRAIYCHPQAWYLSLNEHPQETIEAMLPNDFDVSAWDLRKTLRLFAKCNPSLNEWLGSPTIYKKTSPFFEDLKAHIPTYFNPIKATHHYLALARNAYNETNHIEPPTLTIKKLFYALRGLLAAHWTTTFQTMPPTEFSRLLEIDDLPKDILTIIAEVQEQKKTAHEHFTVLMPPQLHDFYLKKRLSIEDKAKSLSIHHTSIEPLNELFLRTIERF